MCWGASGNTKYYEILGVSKNVSPEDLKKAYERAEAALENHPSNMVRNMKFNEYFWAYKILSDPEKRQLYDQYGEDAVKDPYSVMLMEYYDEIPFDDEVRQRRGVDLVYPLKVSLEDLCSGTSKKLKLLRDVLCSMCNGKGTKSGVSTKCLECQGSGMKVITIGQLGPSMIHQTHSRCYECNGIGESFDDEEDRCPSCMGKKVVTEKKVLKVPVEKGMKIGHKITLPGLADEAPDTITGDIVLVLQAKG